MAKSEVIGAGEPCPKCMKPMARKAHPPEWTPKPTAAYYYEYWDTCKKCSHIQHYEEVKRYPEGSTEKFRKRDYIILGIKNKLKKFLFIGDKDISPDDFNYVCFEVAKQLAHHAGDFIGMMDTDPEAMLGELLPTAAQIMGDQASAYLDADEDES